jgi:hypothetical protein
MLTVHWLLQPHDPAAKADSFGTSTLRLDRHVRFEHDLDILQEEPSGAEGEPPPQASEKREAAAALPEGGTAQHVARVLILQGLSPADRDAILRGPHHEGGAHMVHSLKFVTMRVVEGTRRGAVSALGGPWSAELDGGDPT